MIILLLSACILSWGLAMFLMKLSSQGLAPATSILFTVAGYLLIVPFVIQKADFHLTPRHFLPFLVGVCYVIGNLAYYRLAETQDVTTLAPLTALYVAVPILLGWFVLREPLALPRVLGILLAGVALWLLVVPQKVR